MKTLDDFHTGQRFVLRPFRLEEDEMLEFSRRFDPAPFHLDKEAAEKSILGGLAASGWQTSAIMMRMYSDDVLGPAGSHGAAHMDYMRWLKPCFIDDELSGTVDVKSISPSGSNPAIGYVKMHVVLTNQNDEAILDTSFSAIFPTSSGGSTQ